MHTDKFLMELQASLAARAESVCRRLLPGGKRIKNAWQCGGVDGGPGKSMEVELEGDKAGVWHDRATGESGRLLSLWQENQGITFDAAVTAACAFCNLDADDDDDGPPSTHDRPISFKEYRFDPPPPPKLTRKKADDGPPPMGTDFDWQDCLNAMTDGHVKKLAAWRGFSMEFCQYLHQTGMIGVFRGNFALPVHNAKGEVVRCHYRTEKGWAYFPGKGESTPLVIGSPEHATHTIIGESQWDVFAILDRINHHIDPCDVAGVATRGANCNTDMSMLPCTKIIVVPQNDPSEKASKSTGRTPAQEWQHQIQKQRGDHTKFTVSTIPLEFKDANDWIRAENPRKEDVWKRIITEALCMDVVDEDLANECDTDTEAFPLHCLPAAAGEMAKEMARVTTAQNEALASAAVLGVLSAAMGAGLEVRTGGERRTRPNLFVLAIADSGTGKGENETLAAAPFAALEAEAIESFEVQTRPGLLAELQVAEIRAKTLCKEAAKESDRHARFGAMQQYKSAVEEVAAIQRRIDTAPRWHVADVTKEALAIAMAGQPNQAVASMSSEARGIFSIIGGRYSKGSDEDFYCSGYSGDSCTVDRVGRARVVLPRPCLMTLWMVQPDAARNALATPAMVESGLFPRFLMFDAKAEPKERTEPPKPIPDEVKGAWARLIGELVRTYRMLDGEAHMVKVSPEAQGVLNDYEREAIRRRRKGGDLHDLASFVARWAENAWRVSLVLHAARHGACAHDHAMSGETAVAAVTLLRWFSDQQLHILAASRREKSEKRLLAVMALLASANGEISIRDLRRSHGFEPDEIRHLVDQSPRKLMLTKVMPTDGIGRPSIVLRGFDSKI